MLDAALLNMRSNGRITVCGMVSQHGFSNTDGIHNLFCLITKRVKMQGFLQSDYRHLFPQFLECMINYYKQGKIVYIEDMSEGLESAPSALAGLFTGENVGKKVVCVARPWLPSAWLGMWRYYEYEGSVKSVSCIDWLGIDQRTKLLCVSDTFVI